MLSTQTAVIGSVKAVPGHFSWVRICYINSLSVKKVDTSRSFLVGINVECVKVIIRKQCLGRISIFFYVKIFIS